MSNKMDAVKQNIKKANARIRKGVLTGVISLQILTMDVAMAKAKGVSSLTANWKSETQEIVPVILLIVAGLGVITAAIAVISGVMAKKNQEPLKWQLWGLVGGALAVIVPVLIMATAGSLGSGQGDASGTMKGLGIEQGL